MLDFFSFFFFFLQIHFARPPGSLTVVCSKKLGLLTVDSECQQPQGSCKGTKGAPSSPAPCPTKTEQHSACVPHQTYFSHHIDVPLLSSCSDLMHLTSLEVLHFDCFPSPPCFFSSAYFFPVNPKVCNSIGVPFARDQLIFIREIINFGGSSRSRHPAISPASAAQLNKHSRSSTAPHRCGDFISPRPATPLMHPTTLSHATLAQNKRMHEQLLGKKKDICC